MIEKTLTGKHLLIAEDNPTNQIVVTKMVEMLGGTYDLASDGLEAIELYEVRKYDLALLDIEMPRKSGLEVMRHIRSNPATPTDFLILALTAFVLSEHKVKIREAGANAIIAKPIADVVGFGQSIASHFPNNFPEGNREEMEINTEALDDLKNSLGADVTSSLIENLDNDVKLIQARLKELVKPVDRDLIRVNTHSLLSLAGMAGATGLVENTQNLNNEYDSLTDEELLEASTYIAGQIETLRVYLKKWNENQDHE